jgi:vitamin B12 transporter
MPLPARFHLPLVSLLVPRLVAPTMVAALLCLGSATAAAQASPDTGSLTPVVVTATRVPFAQAVPTTTSSVITGDELRARGIVSVADALRDVAGASPVQTGSPGGVVSLFLRGGQSDYVKVLVDGVPLNEPGGAYSFENLTTADIERIEVVRGPSSVLYGSDAVTGVIQILTKRGAGPLSGAVTANGGNYRSANGTLDLSGSTGLLGYSAGGVRQSTAGILPFNNQYTNGELSGRLDWGRATPTAAALTGRYHTADYHFPTAGDGTPVDHNQHTRDEGSSLSLEANHAFTRIFGGQLTLTSNNDDRATINPQDGPADTNGFFATYDRNVIARNGADGRIDAHLDPRTTLAVGGSFEGQHATSRTADQFNPNQFGPPGFDAPPPTSRHRTVGAGYAELVGNLREAASYSLGLRVDDNSAFGTFGTYRVSVGYAVGYGINLHAALGTAFKEPTFEQNFSRAPFDVGNPHLAPERSTGWEVGIAESPFGEGLVLSATYFNQRFHNIIDYTPSAAPVAGSPGDSTNFVNIAGAIADGIELGLHAGPVAGVSLDLAYTGLLTRVTDNGVDHSGYSQFLVGTRLIRRPAHQFSGTLRHPLGRGSLAVTGRFVGTRDDINFNAPFPGTTARVLLPGYTTVDLAGEYPLVAAGGRGPALSLTVRAINVLNRHYDEVATYAAPGRTVLVGGRVVVGR